MSVADIANGLVSLCKQGKFLDAVNQYYGESIVSVEAFGNEKMPAEMSGIDAIRGKNQWWAENHEVHGLEVAGPYVGDAGFAVKFNLDVTPKMTGQRMTMVEVGWYTVADGKISREEFYYNAPGQ
ncbi:MAG: nuclear transport factor 2 family protein [Acidobacteria bacterium]|nr:nuclear transport factor 2 family protein [Acidobacteriota bacterium]